jgi:hypothetical protein
MNCAESMVRAALAGKVAGADDRGFELELQAVTSVLPIRGVAATNNAPLSTARRLSPGGSSTVATPDPVGQLDTTLTKLVTEFSLSAVVREGATG